MLTHMRYEHWIVKFSMEKNSEECYIVYYSFKFLDDAAAEVKDLTFQL